MDYDGRIMDDGSVIESSIPMEDRSNPAERYSDFKIYKAQVDLVYYADDKDNRTGKVEYDLTLMSSDPNQIYRNVPHAVALNLSGGINNWGETIYKATTKVLNSGKTGAAPTPMDKNGDIVAVMFMEGDETKAVIIGPWAHFRNEGAAKIADGHRMKGEYNGIEWDINKDGEFVLTVLGGPRDDEEALTNESNGGLLIKFDKNGKISIDSGDDAILTIDKNTKTIEIDAAHVKIGTGAAQSLVRGDAFKALFDAHIHPTPVGQSGPPTLPIVAGVEISNDHKVE